MAMAALLAEDEIQQLRETNYNAEIIKIIAIHEDLRIVRVRPDGGTLNFEPGQYSVLGLGSWEPRVGGCDDEQLETSQLRKLLKRAYSFSCPLLNSAGQLLPPSKCDFLEFYIVLVRHGEQHPPGLTPRLFSLKEGDRLFVGPKATGHYTLDTIRPTDDLVFVATGTGEAPHNAMVAELVDQQHTGRLVMITCVRRKRDLGYVAQHRELERRFPNYKYQILTTREPENLHPQLPNYIGKRYLQDYFVSGLFEREIGWRLNPQQTHVFLCGNPAMIGAPLRQPDGQRSFPKPQGMMEILEQRGFKADERQDPGNIHYEKYW
jgi:ferredoxin/flavodoxin---NADP+ reductase